MPDLTARRSTIVMAMLLTTLLLGAPRAARAWCELSDGKQYRIFQLRTELILDAYESNGIRKDGRRKDHAAVLRPPRGINDGTQVWVAERGSARGRGQSNAELGCTLKQASSVDEDRGYLDAYSTSYDDHMVVTRRRQFPDENCSVPCLGHHPSQVWDIQRSHRRRPRGFDGCSVYSVQQFSSSRWLDAYLYPNNDGQVVTRRFVRNEQKPDGENQHERQLWLFCGRTEGPRSSN